MLMKKAGAADTAPKNNRQLELYRRGLTMSRKNLKHEIGELLFCLELPVGQELTQIGWALFERLLRCYVDLTHTGGRP